ncbi:hypothetical protein ScPMuIL_008748 [Solemya velum]
MRMLLQLALMVLMSCQLVRSEPVVSTTSGIIDGLAKNTTNGLVLQFLGVPYAEPPVGPRRFQKPAPFLPRTSTLNGTKYGQSCIQSGSEGTAEDCLTLNIFVPRTLKPSENRSIMVWIHGGAFMIGSSSVYDGSELSLRGDVIVVTMNYRLGLLGFFSTEDERAPGNYGLWDQKLAIEWVKDNAAAFGGNSTSITIFGESAGGSSVVLQAMSLSNTNVFQRAIAQSAYGMEPHVLTSGWAEKVTRMSKILNCTDQSELMLCLRSKNTADILKAQDQLAIPFDKSSRFLLGQQIGPVKDGDLLTDSLENLAQGSTFRLVDFMAGFNDGDGGVYGYTLVAMQATHNFSYTRGIPKNIFCDVFAKALAEQYFPYRLGAADAICDRYTVSNDLIGQSRAILEALRDSSFSVYTIRTVREHSQSRETATYLYQFSHKPAFQILQHIPPWHLGANHADEIAFEFGPRSIYPEPYRSNVSPEEEALTHTIMSYIANFAKHGNPNGVGLPSWPEFKKGRRSYMNLNLTSESGVNLLKETMEFWDQLRHENERAVSSKASVNMSAATTFWNCILFIGFVLLGR